MRAAVTNFFNLVGALDAGLILDSARHVDAEGTYVTHGDADIERVQPPAG
jgi:hypothetical protein